MQQVAPACRRPAFPAPTGFALAWLVLAVLVLWLATPASAQDAGLRAAAERGDAQAQLQLGMAYLNATRTISP